MNQISIVSIMGRWMKFRSSTRYWAIWFEFVIFLFGTFWSRQQFLQKLIRIIRHFTTSVTIMSFKNKLKTFWNENHLFKFFSENTDAITHLLVSSCGKYLIAGDTNSNVVIWGVKNKQWTYHCKLPKYRFPPMTMAIHPSSLNLVIVYSDSKVRKFLLFFKLE